MPALLFIFVCCVLPFEEGSFEEPPPRHAVCRAALVRVRMNFYAEPWRSGEAL